VLTLTRPHAGPETQRYGNIQPDGDPHTGQDYGYTGNGEVFPDVYAAAVGTVLYAGDSRALGWPNPWWFNPDFDRTDAVDSSAGNVIVLGHIGGHVTTYSHLESWSVKAGQIVQAGQRIAVTGSTGRSTGKHLHFELLTYPFDFTTATYGRVDPNPYFATINTLGDVMATLDKEDLKAIADAVADRLFPIIQTQNEQFHNVTRANVINEISAKVEDSEYSVKVFTQTTDNKNADRVILDNREVEAGK
jgi:hypothetical protein